MQNRQERVKKDVRERYTEAVSTGNSCCGNPSELLEIAPPGSRVSACAGYESTELSSLPPDAVRNSFGCGNPVGMAGILPGQSVLDIGSGAGIDCFLAAKRVGQTGKVIGLDMTPLMVQKAQENAKQAGLSNVEFRLGEAESMPVEDRSVDWIISNCVINLSPDKPGVFREMFRVLKPGGRISISDIMLEKLPWILRRSKALYASCVSGAIAEKKYLEGLRKSGFVNVEVTERLVYDPDQIFSFMQASHLFRINTRIIRQAARWLIDRYVSGQIWSARVVAEKPYPS